MPSIVLWKHAVFIFGLFVVAAHFGARTSGQTTIPSANFAVRSIGIDSDIWPGDFNGDGRTDLVGGAQWIYPDTLPTTLLLATGRGDGTFNPPQSLGIRGRVQAVSDLNGDRRTDLVIRTPTRTNVLPGNGNGTFGPPRLVAESSDTSLTFARVADFDADGHRDLALAVESGILIYPGTGGFTFDVPVPIPMAPPQNAFTADFNKDGRIDLLVTAQDCCPAVMFLNRGSFAFTAREIPNSSDLNDLTAGDLNRDGRLDFIATQFFYSHNMFDDEFRPGVVVMLGNGDGTFQPRTEYNTGVRGETTVVVGDFTRDGLLDVATGNQSYLRHDDWGRHLSDSISILRGDGAGRLGSPVTFPIEQFDSKELATSDLNGDRQTDLLSSPGTILLNRPAVTNRPPTVFLGPDRTFSYDLPWPICAASADPDNHWLSYRWDHDWPGIPCAFLGFMQAEPGTYDLGLTVDDGQGGVASDSVRIVVAPTTYTVIDLDTPRGENRFGEDDGAELVPVGRTYEIRWKAIDWAGRITRFDVSYSTDDGRTFQPINGCTGMPGTSRSCSWQSPTTESQYGRIRVAATYNGAEQWREVSGRLHFAAGQSHGLPPAWTHGDIGAVQTHGNAAFDGISFTVQGSGADIWSRADELHYARTRASGNFDFTARIARLQAVNQWTKAGIMVRSNSGPGAPQVSLIATPTAVKGIVLQSRAVENGLSSSKAGPAIAPPAWLRIARRGNSVYASYRQSTSDPWTFIGSAAGGFGDSVEVGLAVTSHADGTTATAVFDNVRLDAAPQWSNVDIGAVAIAGRKACCFDNPLRTALDASGTDIWGRLDAFRYEYTSWFADRTITARVLGIQNTHAWAKAGVMVRESLDPNSRNVAVLITPSKGVTMQSRTTTGGQTVQMAAKLGAAPRWVRLTRAGDTIIGYLSADGVSWTTIGAVIVPMESHYAGVAVTSHNNAALATGAFDDVTVQQWP